MKPYKGPYFQTPGYEKPPLPPQKSVYQTLKNKYGKVVFPSEFANPVNKNVVFTTLPMTSPAPAKLQYPGKPMTDAEKNAFERKLAAKLENNDTWNNDILTMSQEELNSLIRARKRTSSDPKSVNSRSSTPFKGGKRKARRFTKRRAKRSTRKH